MVWVKMMWSIVMWVIVIWVIFIIIIMIPSSTLFFIHRYLLILNFLFLLLFFQFFWLLYFIFTSLFFKILNLIFLSPMRFCLIFNLEIFLNIKNYLLYLKLILHLIQDQFISLIGIIPIMR